MPRPPGKRPSVSVRVFGACSKRFCARRTIGYRHQPDGFSRGKKLVACFLKLVARISKSEPLIFSLLRCGVNALKISFRFSAPEMSVLRRISHPCRDAIHRGRVARHRIWLRPASARFPCGALYPHAGRMLHIPGLLYIIMCIRRAAHGAAGCYLCSWRVMQLFMVRTANL